MGRNAALFHDAAEDDLASAGLAGMNQYVLGPLAVALSDDLRVAIWTKVNLRRFRLFRVSRFE